MTLHIVPWKTLSWKLTSLTSFRPHDVSESEVRLWRKGLDMSSYEHILRLLSIQQGLYRFGGPIFVCIGTISAVMGLLVFNQKGLRKNPCSIYFTAYNVAILLLISTSFLPLTLDIGYNISLSTENIHLCRLRLFTTFLFNCLCPYYLLLASIDRGLVTSPDARTRQRSTQDLAYNSIIIGTVCWMIGLSHVLVFSTINSSLLIGRSICYVQLGWYSKAISYSSLAKELVIPFLMIIFGMWSIKHIRNARRVMVAFTSRSGTGKQSTTTSTSVRGRDRQLMIMLLIDSSIYVVFSLVLAIQLMYEQITIYALKSPEKVVTEHLIKSVAMFSAHVPFCITSFVNLLVSKTFRKEVKDLICWKQNTYGRQQHQVSTA